MKKIYLILSLMGLWSLNPFKANAENVAAESLQPDKYYTIKQNGDRGYMTYNQTRNANLVWINAATASNAIAECKDAYSATDKNNLWGVYPLEDGAYIIYNAGNGKSFKLAGSAWTFTDQLNGFKLAVPDAEQPTVYRIKDLNSVRDGQDNTLNFAPHQQSNPICSWNDAGSNLVFEVSDVAFDETLITNLIARQTTYLTEQSTSTYAGYGGKQQTAIDALKNALSSLESAGTNAAKLQILWNATKAWNEAPLVVPEDGWYKIKCDNQGVYLSLNPDKQEVTVNSTGDNIESLWYLKKSGTYTCTIQSAATHEYISETTSTTPVTVSKTPATYTLAFNYGTNCQQGSCAIKYSASSAIFQNGGMVNGYFASSSIGNSWKFEPISEENLNSYVTTDANEEKFIERIKSNSTPVHQDMKLFADWYDETKTANELAALESEFNFNNVNNYANAILREKTNGFYYIISAYKAFDDGIDRYVYVDTDNSLKWTKSKSNEVSMLWKLTLNPDEYNANGYNITSVNYNRNIQTAGWSGTAGTTDNVYSISIVQSPEANTKTGGVQLIHYVKNDRQTLALTGETLAKPTKDEDNKGLSGLNSNAADVATHFLLVRAESVNLSTTATSNGNWSTTYLPIAVQLPAEATAYYVSAAVDGKATLKECAENKIAAEDGAVIKSDAAGTIAATILTEDVSKADNNLLKGSLTGTNVPEAGYILADKTQGVGFYKIDPTNAQIAGNKAYLEVSAASAAGIKAFTFDFGGTTGIENTEAVTEVEEYYDLQGRRVMNPTKGIYVTKSGKKVLFTK